MAVVVVVPVLVPPADDCEVVTSFLDVEVLAIDGCGCFGDGAVLLVVAFLELLHLGECGLPAGFDLLIIHFSLRVEDLRDLAFRDADGLAVFRGVVSVGGCYAVALFVTDEHFVARLEVFFAVPLKVALVGGYLAEFLGYLGGIVHDLRHLAVGYPYHLAVLGGVVTIGSGGAVTLGIFDIHIVTCFEVFVAIPGEDALVGSDGCELREHLGEEFLDAIHFSHIVNFEVFAEFARKCAGYGIHAALVLLRHQIKEALKREALEVPVLHLRPDVRVGDMELREERAVADIVEALRGDTRGAVLDEPLHHLHSADLLAIVHQVDIVLPTLG